MSPNDLCGARWRKSSYSDGQANCRARLTKFWKMAGAPVKRARVNRQVTIRTLVARPLANLLPTILYFPLANLSGVS